MGIFADCCCTFLAGACACCCRYEQLLVVEKEIGWSFPMVCGILCPSLLLFMNQSNLGVCLGALAWSCIITANLEKKIFYYVFVQISKFNAQHIIFVP